MCMRIVYVVHKKEGISMWEELGISSGTVLLILIVLYFVIKWAVKNGIKEAYRDITAEKNDPELSSENSDSDEIKP